MSNKLEYGSFGIFPMFLMEGLSANEQLLLVWLWFHKNNGTSKCWPSLRTLMKETNMSKNLIIKATKSLEEKGLILIERRTGKKGENVANLYTVMMKKKGGTSALEGLGPSALEGLGPSALRGHELEEAKPEESNHNLANDQGSPVGSPAEVGTSARDIVQVQEEETTDLPLIIGRPSSAETGKAFFSQNVGQKVNELMGIFSKVNPMLNFGNKTERKALEEIIKKRGFEIAKLAVEGVVEAMESGDKYAPRITKPTELISKYGKLKAWLERQ